MSIPSEGKVDRNLPESGLWEREYSVIGSNPRNFVVSNVAQSRSYVQ